MSGGPASGLARVARTIRRPSIGVPVLPKKTRKAGDEGGGETRKSQLEKGTEKRTTGAEKDRPTCPERGSRSVRTTRAETEAAFRALARQLRAHIKKLVRSGEQDPLSKLRDAERVLDQDAEEFIRSHRGLNRIWDGWGRELVRQLLDLSAQIRATRGDEARISELTKRYEDIAKAKAKLDDFGRGKVGGKRPDLLELFFRNRRAVVTDITQRLRRIRFPVTTSRPSSTSGSSRSFTGWSNVAGIEYSSPTEQKLPHTVGSRH